MKKKLIIFGIVMLSIILIIGIELYLFLKNEDVLNKEHVIDNEITILDVDVDYVNLNILKGDKLKIETNNRYIAVREIGKKLVVEEKEHSNATVTKYDNDLTIYMPEKEYNYLFLDAGAGTVLLENLSFKKAKIDLGTGKATIKNFITINTIKLKASSGEVNIENSEMHNLDMNLGVGLMNINAKIIGNSDIECDVGDTKINLIGNQDDYQVRVEKGIGNIIVNNNVVSDNTIVGKGENYIIINGGVGNINISFQK